MSWSRRPVYKDVSPAEMLTLREQGMTNKQIAQQCGCHVNTVYRYIGKKSHAVANAAAQNKPMPVPMSAATGFVGNTPVRIKEEARVQETSFIENDMTNIVAAEPELRPQSEYVGDMLVLKERKIMELKGEFCVFEVDTGDGTVVMKSGDESAMVTGMLDADGVFQFCRELMKIHGLISRKDER